GGLEIELIFQNNLKGTHQTIVTFATNVVLVPLGDKIVIPKQPVLGGVGGNPHIFIQFFNNAGNLSDEIYLGRCVQGLKLENDFLNATLAQVLIGSEGCYNHPGPSPQLSLVLIRCRRRRKESLISDLRKESSSGGGEEIRDSLRRLLQ